MFSNWWIWWQGHPYSIVFGKTFIVFSRRCFCSKLTIFGKKNIARFISKTFEINSWHEPIHTPTSLGTFLNCESAIFHNRFFHFLHVFIGCCVLGVHHLRRLHGIAYTTHKLMFYSYQTYNTPLLTFHTLCYASFNFFLRKIWLKFFDPFLLPNENRQAHKNTSNLSGCQSNQWTELKFL